jgi:hypothetical protein
MKTLLALLMLLFTSPFATAQSTAQSPLETDDYIVHYSAFNSTHLLPEIAKLYGIQRSRQRAVLNITVQRKRSDGSVVSVQSPLSGQIRHLAGTVRPLSFNLAREGQTLYYLAEFLISDGEKLLFDIKATPHPDKPTLNIRFEQTFYTD